MPHDYPQGSTRAKGQSWEDRAARHLDELGWRIVERNAEYGGVELDLIALDPAGVHVFVEVRSRGRADRGHPLETVDITKQRRLVRGAKAWLCAHGLWERVDVRFDVVAIVDDGPRARVEHVRDAFWA